MAIASKTEGAAMIKYQNYCKPEGHKLLGIPNGFDDETDGELLPCPLCGRIPEPMVRADSLDGYFAAVSCFGGECLSHAYVSAKGHDGPQKILHQTIEKWNHGPILLDDEQGERQWYRE